MKIIYNLVYRFASIQTWFLLRTMQMLHKLNKRTGSFEDQLEALFFDEALLPSLLPQIIYNKERAFNSMINGKGAFNHLDYKQKFKEAFAKARSKSKKSLDEADEDEADEVLKKEDTLCRLADSIKASEMNVEKDKIG